MLKFLILLVAPYLTTSSVSEYESLIKRYSNGLDHKLIVAVIWVESRFRSRAKSRTNDYGLMQLHVSSDTHQQYIGRERVLYNPKLNIKLGTKMMRLWRRYHRCRCKSKKHHWISHYQQGSRVRSLRYERAVLSVLRLLTVSAQQLAVLSQ